MNTQDESIPSLEFIKGEEQALAECKELMTRYPLWVVESRISDRLLGIGNSSEYQKGRSATFDYIADEVRGMLRMVNGDAS